MSLRERAKFMNSVTILLKGLVGHVTTLELRNESSVRGRIVHVDYLMNTSLSNAVFTGPDGRQQMRCEDFYIQGKNIRYVQIPDDIDIIKTMQSELDQMHQVRTYSERKPKQTPTEKKQEKKMLQKKRVDDAVEAMKASLATLSEESTGQQPKQTPTEKKKQEKKMSQKKRVDDAVEAMKANLAKLSEKSTGQK